MAWRPEELDLICVGEGGEGPPTFNANCEDRLALIEPSPANATLGKPSPRALAAFPESDDRETRLGAPSVITDASLLLDRRPYSELQCTPDDLEATTLQALSTDQLLRLHENRETALKRKQSRIGSIHTAVSNRETQMGNLTDEQCIVQATLEPSHKLYLAIKNYHRRDQRIMLLEAEHVYLLDSYTKFPQSVSSVWEAFFEHFDAELVIEKYFARWATDVSSKYYDRVQVARQEGVSDAIIKQAIAKTWQTAGAEARAKGTYVHRQIELFLNGYEHDIASVEMQQFRDFLREFAVPRRWVPYRTEWAIYDETLMVAGQIDCVFVELGTNKFHMVDWKRIEKDLDPEEGRCFGRYGKLPCNFLLDNTFNRYVMQQNLYAAILHDCYDIHCATMWLVQIHPNRANYTAIAIPSHVDVAKEMLETVSTARVPCATLDVRIKAAAESEVERGVGEADPPTLPLTRVPRTPSPPRLLSAAIESEARAAAPSRPQCRVTRKPAQQRPVDPLNRPSPVDVHIDYVASSSPRSRSRSRSRSPARA